MEERKKEIIVNATAVYMKYGIKSVTMDEMARQLGISKKTLYQYFTDKNDLVEECIRFAHTDEECEIQKIRDEYENAIDALLATSRFVIDQLKKVHPSIFFDLERYHPSAMKIMNDHLNEFVKNCVESNLEKGIKQGLYRKNLNTDIISKMYLQMIGQVLAGDIFESNAYPMEQIYKEFFRYHIRGIASENGLEYLIELKKNNENI